MQPQKYSKSNEQFSIMQQNNAASKKSPTVFQNATFKRFSRMQLFQKYSKSKGFPECRFFKTIQSPKNGFPECNRQYKQYFPLNQRL
jgi:hypothetical protein